MMINHVAGVDLSVGNVLVPIDNAAGADNMPIRQRPGRPNCYEVEGVRQRPETCLSRERAMRQLQAVQAARANARRRRRGSS